MWPKQGVDVLDKCDPDPRFLTLHFFWVLCNVESNQINFKARPFSRLISVQEIMIIYRHLCDLFLGLSSLGLAMMESQRAGFPVELGL